MPGAASAELIRLWPAVPGAAIAAAGLLPGLLQDSAPQPIVAAVAPAAGLGVAALVPTAHGRSTAPANPSPHKRRDACAETATRVSYPSPTRAGAPARVMRAAVGTFARRRVVVLLVAAAVISLPLVTVAAGGPIGALVATRLSADSPERADLRQVTAEQFASAPLVGVGTGRLDLVYVDYLGRFLAAEYTHDEFLQTAAETGVVVGAGLTVAVFACLGAAAFRRRHTAGGPFAAAILAAFAVHSTFDFLWHSAPQCVEIVTPTTTMRHC